MGELSMTGILVRFLLGGSSVAASSIMAKKFGGKWGGIFASFPAVYLAALLTTGLDVQGPVLLQRSLTLSQGALVGMIADIIFALAAAYLCARRGWKSGLLIAFIGWLSISLAILTIRI